MHRRRGQGDVHDKIGLTASTPDFWEFEYFGCFYLFASYYIPHSTMSRIALTNTARARAALPAANVHVHALRHASSSTSSPASTSTSTSTPRSEINDAARKSRTTHFGFREIPEEDKETMGVLHAHSNASSD